MNLDETKPRKASTTMRLPTDLRKRVQKLADKEERSETNMTIILLKDAVTRREKKEAKTSNEQPTGIFS
jgi:predicted transcriptional regulator